MIFNLTKKVKRRHVIGCLLLGIGLFLASLTGSQTSLALPGVGKITLGAGAGATVGFLSWLAVGTLGVATGGVGIALGAVGLTAIGALIGGIGGTASGFGILTETYPLVPWTVWVPIVILGIYFLWGRRDKENSEANVLEGPKSER